jgi:hypothetical protein
MTTPDDALEARLRRLAAEHDAPPDDVLAAARAAWETRDLDAELAALVADSWTDAQVVATRAAASDVRMLTFEVDGVTVEVDVELDPVTRTARLQGFARGASGEVATVRVDGRLAAPVVDGHFDLVDVPLGPARLEFTAVDGRRVSTAWFSV